MTGPSVVVGVKLDNACGSAFKSKTNIYTDSYSTPLIFALFIRHLRLYLSQVLETHKETNLEQLKGLPGTLKD